MNNAYYLGLYIAMFEVYIIILDSFDSYEEANSLIDTVEHYNNHEIYTREEVEALDQSLIHWTELRLEDEKG